MGENTTTKNVWWLLCCRAKYMSKSAMSKIRAAVQMRSVDDLKLLLLQPWISNSANAWTTDVLVFCQNDGAGIHLNCPRLKRVIPSWRLDGGRIWLVILDFESFEVWKTQIQGLLGLLRAGPASRPLIRTCMYIPDYRRGLATTTIRHKERSNKFDWLVTRIMKLVSRSRSHARTPDVLIGSGRRYGPRFCCGEYRYCLLRTVAVSPVLTWITLKIHLVLSSNSWVTTYQWQ